MTNISSLVKLYDYCTFSLQNKLAALSP